MHLSSQRLTFLVLQKLVYSNLVLHWFQFAAPLTSMNTVQSVSLWVRTINTIVYFYLSLKSFRFVFTFNCKSIFISCIIDNQIMKYSFKIFSVILAWFCKKMRQKKIRFSTSRSFLTDFFFLLAVFVCRYNQTSTDLGMISFCY